MNWFRSWRADPQAREMADRHYNRQKIGHVQFAPPGRCLVLRARKAVWITSYPYAEFVKHEWAGAWVNSLFRNEGEGIASELIRGAVAATLCVWEPPLLGMITFVDPKKVRPTKIRGKEMFGYCYHVAGFEHVGYTKAGLWAWQMFPWNMPDRAEAMEFDL